MPRENILRNRKRLLKEILNEDAGEQIIRGSFDADVRVIYDFQQVYSQPGQQEPKAKRMTIFATNHRVIAYQAANWVLGHDKFAELPLTELDRISFAKFEEKGKLVAIAELIAFKDSKYPSLTVKFDSSGHPLDLKSFTLVLSGISKLSGAKITDYTNEAQLASARTR